MLSLALTEPGDGTIGVRTCFGRWLPLGLLATHSEAYTTERTGSPRQGRPKRLGCSRAQTTKPVAGQRKRRLRGTFQVPWGFLCSEVKFLSAGQGLSGGASARQGAEAGVGGVWRTPGGAPQVRQKTRVALLSVASNTTLVVLKLVVGLLVGSVAIVSEAIHSGMDLVAALIALFAVRKSGEAADERHPYGHGKFENISAAIEALLIFGAAAWIIYEAVQRLLHPRGIDMAVWGVMVMALSAGGNLLVSHRLFKVARETDSVALEADGWHLRTDVYTSAGLMVGLLVMWMGGHLWAGVRLDWIDSTIAILVALLILKAAVDLVRTAVRDLLDVSLPAEDVQWIPGFVIGNWRQVRGFHNLRSRKAGPTRFVDFHVVVDDHMSVSEAHRLGDEIVAALKERLSDSRINIHIEPCDFQCPPNCEAGCSMDEQQRRAGAESRPSATGEEQPK